jgi:hypothetical protein
MKAKMPLGMLVNAVLIAIAAFLPWSGTRDLSGTSYILTPGTDLFVTAWNSGISLLGTLAPNWLLTASMLVLAGIGVASYYQLGKAPAFMWLLIIYNGFHAGVLLYMFIDGHAYPGLGLLLTIACGITLLVQFFSAFVVPTLDDAEGVKGLPLEDGD